MDKETKQDLLTIALLMKKAREQEESNKQAKDQYSECDVEATAETCLSDDDEQFLETQDEALETQDDADRLVRQLLSSGIDKYEDMIRHVALKQPDEYKRLKPLLRKTWNFWCRNPRMEITYERSKEICEKIEAEMTKEASEQRHKKYDMKTMKGRLLAAIEDHIVTSENFGSAEELLLAVWLLCVDKVDASISYDHCQSRTAVHFTYDRQSGAVDGIDWAYDYDKDVLGELTAIVLGHEFTHQAVWERHEDSWFEETWSGPSGEVCKELNDALDSRVHSGGCDDMVLDEEPYVDRDILKVALKNTRQRDRFHYILADREKHVYFASDKKFDEYEQEWYWMVETDSYPAIKVPIGMLGEISEEQCVDLLLHQKLIVSEEFGEAGENRLWDPATNKLIAVAKDNHTQPFANSASDNKMSNVTQQKAKVYPLPQGGYLARDVASQLCKAMKAHSYTPTALAAGLGIPRHVMVCWHNGHGIIPVEMIQRICKHMGISITELGIATC